MDAASIVSLERLSVPKLGQFAALSRLRVCRRTPRTAMTLKRQILPYTLEVRRVAFIAVPPIQVIDLVGPFEVFARCGGYQAELYSTAPEITTSCGLFIGKPKHYRALRGPVDTLLIPGGDGSEDLMCEPEFVPWLRQFAARARRVGSICTGAFVLGAAGL